MSDLQQFITMMLKGADGMGVDQKITITGDSDVTMIRFLMDDYSGQVDDPIKTAVTFDFDIDDGSFKSVYGGFS